MKQPLTGCLPCCIGKYLLLSIVIVAGGFGQVARSSLTGTVTDPQRHRIPGATVRAVEKETGLERHTTTSSDGTYSLDALPVGWYSVSFSKAGFADFTADDVEQTVAHTRTLDAQLNLATGAAQRVSITEPLIQLDRSNAAVGAPVERGASKGAKA